MRTVTARVLLITFTGLWILLIHELTKYDEYSLVVTASVVMYGLFVAFALEVDEREGD